ncbi:platelet-activating factor acetylhydrolase 2, cytoplasmic [Lepeophtheirus salmonis]|uniref:1-alkyl-2-acetylglycerophosphocholine esterase n=1 Tax=Lepeophtheirus salmonis TaxID=72036 RepID=A0A0K2TT46_LEPSM|nr:platelet-activating factor acetylhydrolase 2, cytoplasmic-like [Lepeophtheirus salmonis]
MSFGNQSGPHAIGFKDEFLEESGLTYRLFYPMSQPSTLPSTLWVSNTSYLIALVRFGLGRRVWPVFTDFFHWIFRYPHLPILQEASPLPGPFPLVLFSHGLGGSKMTYSKLCTHIASYGFVVASLEHLDGSAALALRYPDTWIDYQAPHQKNNSLPFRNSQIDTRIQELRSVQKALRSKPFIDENKSILCGHSFGAATILALLHEDPSVYLGGVAYDTWVDPLSQRQAVLDNAHQIGSRTLLFNNELFIKKVNQDLLKAFDNGIDNNWTLKGILHFCQSDVPTVVKNARLLPYLLRGRFDFERDEKGFDLSVLAFVHYVRNKLLTTEEGNETKNTHFNDFIEEHKDFIFKGV